MRVFWFIFKAVWCSSAIFTENRLGNDGFQKAQTTLATAKTSFLHECGKKAHAEDMSKFNDAVNALKEISSLESK